LLFDFGIIENQNSNFVKLSFMPWRSPNFVSKQKGGKHIKSLFFSMWWYPGSNSAFWIFKLDNMLGVISCSDSWFDLERASSYTVHNVYCGLSCTSNICLFIDYTTEFSMYIIQLYIFLKY
jgi:hypothetical protein